MDGGQIQEILFNNGHGKIVSIDRLHGALTNQVYKIVTEDSHNVPILVRIYGTTIENIIDINDNKEMEQNKKDTNLLNDKNILSNLFDRKKEEEYMRILSFLEITPKWFNSFPQGRIEEWIDGNVLASNLLRDSKMSSLIAKQMRRMHSSIQRVNIKENGLNERLGKWREMAFSSFSILSFHDCSFSSSSLPFTISDVAIMEKILNFELKQEMKELMTLSPSNATCLQSNDNDQIDCDFIVLGHCDLHSGNIMIGKGMVEEEKMYFIDLEYALPVPAAYDIANHFNEWMADYSESMLFDSQRYPTIDEQIFFLKSYLGIDDDLKSDCNDHLYLYSLSSISSKSTFSNRQLVIEKWLKRIKSYSKISHLLWAYWCIVQIAFSKTELERENYILCLRERFKQLTA